MNAEVVGSGGVGIGLRVAGEANARPIVFVHGWAQNALVWSHQLADPMLANRFRLVAMDLRGHGNSDVPVEGFIDPEVWAGDLCSVLEFAGTPAMVVGWSYGGLVIADYLRVYGGESLAGIVLVGAITEIGRGREGGRIGPAMRAALPDALSEDLDVALPALLGLNKGMSANGVPGPLSQALLGASLSVSPKVRAALFSREVDNADLLAGVDVPTLVVHGTADGVVDPRSGEYAAGKIPGAQLRWLQGVGHLPFIEAAEEFNSTLLRFAEDRLAPAP
ncbi:Pimeloyl-ACP methyl ester carboxylesterase [Amycolatopsis arida]|uniref:Pimeloyl-ACP methyl ester carboxylesterase n=1 Tax=Amycolatopsis arida TaxID=587909 RepID=A0A1I5YAQ0_9PSEU|nr:alpha/beta hydrolase [Amycolatopsis arida]TDX90390.1 pimeloyl-ACP methyl ester carboxylesterase [Amycolatopsis arida]SFQ41269.1 Pimeloyl-ACP methyl ester carboxylesterase [Amycolatopsis arida]